MLTSPFPRMRISKDILTIGIAFICVLAVIFGFIGKSVFSHREGDSARTALQQKNTPKKYPTLPTEAFRLKIAKNEPVEIIDLRPSLLYEEEHIPDAKHKTVADLADYTPAEGAEVIIITLADDAVSMEQIDAVFRKKNFPYAFLESGMVGWKSQNGNTVSIGNPDSVTDRAKVSFKTAAEIKTIIEGNERNFYTLIDTRPALLYGAGHIPGAINIPLEELERRKSDIPRARHIVVYGKNDLESFRSAVRLYDINIFSPYALENGFLAWTEKKYNTEK